MKLKSILLKPKYIIPLLAALLIVLTIGIILFQTNTESDQKKPDTTGTIVPNEDRQQKAQEARPLSKPQQNQLSTAEKSRLDLFTKQLPYETSLFEVRYVESIGKYFVYLKDTDSIDLALQYLKDQGVYDIYFDGTGLILITIIPIDEAVLDYVDFLEPEIGGVELDKEPVQ